MPESLTLTINGHRHRIEADPEMPLLYLLRDQLGLNCPKYGCGLEQCGSCMVLLDGVKHPSCRIPLSQLKDRQVTTLEGLGSHPVKEALVKEQAAQCGYCLNGVVMAAVSLLNSNPRPSDQEWREGLERNLCRCGTGSRILRALSQVRLEVESDA